MPIDTSRLWEHVALGEDTDLELNEARFRGNRVSGPRGDDLADELAAFANARGGHLVLGVSDNRQPQGLDTAQLDALANLVTEICSDSVKPPLDFGIFRGHVPEPANGGALVVEIPESATVHRFPGGHFRRHGDKKRQMDSAEIRRLSQARGQSDAAATDTQRNVRSSRRWSTRWCIATTRCRGRGYACSCSTIGWSCIRRAGCAIR